MTRRRSTPWIHRWSRPLIGAIATLGILNTGYITYNKLFSQAVACPSGGCERVLESPYATIFGLPLSLFGLLAYLAIAVFALVPLVVSPEHKKSLRTSLENSTWLLLFAGTTAMLLFSGYLMYIMFSKFVANYGVNGVCYFCIASALFATAMFTLTLIGREWNDRGQLFFVGAIVSMVTLITTLAVYAPIGRVNANAATIGDANGNAYFLVENSSGEAELGLARHLKQTGAKMYSAYWCPHCCEQKQLFGKEAMNEIPNVECADGGKDAQVETCKAIAPEIEKQTGKGFGFPTWEINGKYYGGRQTLEELAQNSGYTGPQNFQNSFKACRQP
ncbi:vitamin K epoxide reductase family protein [Myxacorys almedinensis]|uniref:Vitamin K epoxide reductase domain-containing protein n=1 Tax=Myxacorys almedinensis A TaxID=2690445 RepID=A0A8J7Z3M3_9CYAN|nr:vitamin K epoxide reductase family protein [Myxacorys almedinensis]NDJ19812.1 hypothetical protein [Myxacorys almedinensis A]